MASDEEPFGNLSYPITLPQYLLEAPPGLTLDDDLFSHTFIDSCSPSIESIAEMIPQQTEMTLDDSFLHTIIAPSIEQIPVMNPQQTEIPSSLPEEVDNINSGVVPSAVHGVEVKQLEVENKVHEKEKSKRPYVVWTEEEHRSFLKGLDECKGKISKVNKTISEKFVVTKTPSQVASHKQKFDLRQKKEKGKRHRSSINDITQY